MDERAEFNLKYNFKWAQEEKKDDDQISENAGGVIELESVMDPPEENKNDKE